MTHTQKDALSLSALARISCENARFCAQYTRLSDIVSAVLIAADIPLLFGINLRLIQQIGAAYGFDVSGPEFGPLVLSIFNVASSGSKESKKALFTRGSLSSRKSTNACR